jgi:hypothetical protein
MSASSELLARLEKRGIRVWLENGENLRYSGAADSWDVLSISRYARGLVRVLKAQAATNGHPAQPTLFTPDHPERNT